MPRRRRARGDDDRRPPGHGARHRTPGGLSERPEVITGDELQGPGRQRPARTPAPGGHVRTPQARAQAAPGAAAARRWRRGGHDRRRRERCPRAQSRACRHCHGRAGTDVAREAAARWCCCRTVCPYRRGHTPGRRIDDNVRKATRFVFAVHVPIIALALAPTLLHWPALLLLPVHIVLMELLIDPACSIVFEAEPGARHHAAPARAVADSPFALRALWPALLQGAGVAALLLARRPGCRPRAGAWPRPHGGVWHPGAVRAAAHPGAARRLGAGARRRAQPLAAAMVAAVGLLLAACWSSPAWAADGAGEPGLPGLAAGAAVLLPCLAWLELLRQLRLRLARANGAPRDAQTGRPPAGCQTSVVLLRQRLSKSSPSALATPAP